MMSIYWRDAIGHEGWPMSLAVTGVHVNARSEARGLKLVEVRPGTNTDVNIGGRVYENNCVGDCR